MTANTPQTDAEDDVLVRNVKPTGWQNAAPARCYDLVVVGGGTAGLVSAVGAVGLGARVALIESEALGGDCLNTGCVPSKALLESARRAAAAATADEYGVEIEGSVQVDFHSVMDRMRRLRAEISHHDSAARLSKLGVDVFFGQARFTHNNQLTVDHKNLRFKRSIIATGARPAVPPIPGIDTVDFLTSHTIFSLQSLPPRIVILGAGPIGCELAQAFARFGSEVFLLEVSNSILPKEDREAVSLLETSLQRDGVHIFTACANIKVAQLDNGIEISFSQKNIPQKVAVDRMMVATGRQANVESLSLEDAQVCVDASGRVRVDDFLRTTNRRIYAAGDVCSPYQFTHAADSMARIAVGNALFGLRSRASELLIPWATYTSPEIAQIGILPDQAAQRGLKIDTLVQPLSEIDRCVLDGETEGFVKVYVRQRSDKIVGATVVGRRAGDLVGTLSLAMNQQCGLKQMAKTIFPYPTEGEVFRRLGDQYNRRRLSPLIKWLLARWIAWR